ncbi:MAG: hypothetical protein MUE81_09080 [Thermoflexibacter sp.]|jgi:hypothetical protein|nr:hypothetical protein [Thermoflexibacter sp.]
MLGWFIAFFLIVTSLGGVIRILRERNFSPLFTELIFVVLVISVFAGAFYFFCAWLGWMGMIPALISASFVFQILDKMGFEMPR